MTFSYKPYKAPPKGKAFSQNNYDKLRDNHFWYQVSGKHLVARPWKQDRLGHTYQKFRMVLEPIPEKNKKQTTLFVKPPWNNGSKGRHHIYL